VTGFDQTSTGFSWDSIEHLHYVKMLVDRSFARHTPIAAETPERSSVALDISIATEQRGKLCFSQVSIFAVAHEEPA
jgi:hypothetical protein